MTCAVSSFSSSGNFQTPLSPCSQCCVSSLVRRMHLQICVYLQPLLCSRPSGDTSHSQACSEKIFLTLPASHSSSQARSPGSSLNEIVLTYTVSGGCTRELSSAFRNKLLTRIFSCLYPVFPLAFSHEIPVVRPTRGNLKPI